MKTRTKILIFIIFSLVLTNPIKAQNLKNLEDINDQVWSKFYQVFDSLDYNLMETIHSKHLIRIPADNKVIFGYKDYMEQYKITFAKIKENKSNLHISLRFFERINNDLVASERGIYKMIINPNKKNEKVIYGKFHVILIKENGVWKILMDYDSNENNTIGEENFKKAHEINDFKAYLKE